jgi:hypothetical protein
LLYFPAVTGKLSTIQATSERSVARIRHCNTLPPPYHQTFSQIY